MERGRVNNHSPESFLKSVIAARMENLKKNYKWEFSKGRIIGKSDKAIANKIIDNEKQSLKRIARAKANLNIKEAQDLIELLRCK